MGALEAAAPTRPVNGGAGRLPAIGLARSELRIGTRSAVFRALAAAAAVLGWSVAGGSGIGAGMSAYAAGEASWHYLGLLAIVWMSLAAARESVLGTTAIVYSKPQPTERLVLAKFVGLFGQVLLITVALFVGGVLGHVVHGGGLVGLPAYGLQLVRAAGVLFFACAASYSLALLAESAVAGMLVGLYWTITMAGQEYLSKVYFAAYWQNLPAYVALGAAVLAVGAWFYRRRRRGDAQPAAWVRVGVPVCALVCAWLVYGQVRYGHDPLVHTDPVFVRVGMQTITPNRVIPGFLLRDQNGRLTEPSDFPGRIMVVALWTPKDVEASDLMAALQRLHDEYGSKGVQPLAVCINEDLSAGPTFALGQAATFPVVSDWGSHNAPRLMEASPVAEAYLAGPPPTVVVTDRRRRLRVRVDGTRACSYTELKDLVEQRLAEEPR